MTIVINHSIDIRDLIPSVIHIAKKAAEIIMEIYENPFGVRHKSDDSPVTDADITADLYIGNALSNLTPGYPVLSEESARPPFKLRSTWRRFWLVDPLDGTLGAQAASAQVLLHLHVLRLEGLLEDFERLLRPRAAAHEHVQRGVAPLRPGVDADV